MGQRTSRAAWQRVARVRYDALQRDEPFAPFLGTLLAYLERRVSRADLIHALQHTEGHVGVAIMQCRLPKKLETSLLPHIPLPRATSRGIYAAAR